MKDLTEMSDVWEEDITKSLVNMCSFKIGQSDLESLKDIVYWIYSAQQNPYNTDSWRVFYNVLTNVCGVD